MSATARNRNTLEYKETHIVEAGNPAPKSRTRRFSDPLHTRHKFQRRPEGTSASGGCPQILAGGTDIFRPASPFGERTRLCHSGYRLIVNSPSVSLQNMTNHPSEAPDTLHIENFEPLRGAEFTLHMGGEKHSILLSEVTLLKNMSPDTLSRPPFSLLFKSESQQVIPQGLHQLEGPALGKMAMFLVPVGRDAGGVSYEAIFS
ncbi:DUF6916 family protein [Novosphingobium naphthalenivorans]|uniref:DUF6916 family protein n=1 Tax=Novosphingobium naphthalenivorans TaxID=273168 RepID=UPI0012ED3371|nr:hypothetical protein [Novosphingobium naphthalenivorans]